MERELICAPARSPPRSAPKCADGAGPLTLGQALTARVRLVVWCKRCNHQVEPDIAEQVARCGPEMTAIEWTRRLRCSNCGAQDADFVVSGYRAPFSDVDV